MQPERHPDGPDWTPDSPVSVLPGVGPVRGEALADAGIETIGDFLYHLPRRYEDRRRLMKIADLGDDDYCVLVGHISELRIVRGWRRRLSLLRGVLDDGSGRLDLVWFNRPYLKEQLDGEKSYRLYGRLKQGKAGPQLTNPSCDEEIPGRLPAPIVPVYPLIPGLGPTMVRRLLEAVLTAIDLPRQMAEYLPPELLRRHRLSALGEALTELHRPAAGVDLEALANRSTPAHRRLIYGELLDLQLQLGLRRQVQTSVPKAHAYPSTGSWQRVVSEVLPFSMTGAQQRAVDEITADLRRPAPMMRLLQGDVGSGKTAVALAAMILALENDLQVAFMAPTELLAEQHHRTLCRLLGGRYRIALLTGSTTGPAAVERLAGGDVQLAVGTHALIQERVEFARLGLAVIDEQHRFGVAQRQRLESKGRRPDLLVMTATPIPRSLSLTVYGDLDLSVIDELPPGRQPVATRVAPRRRRAEAYRWLAEQVAAGAQAYVVAPLIDPNDELRAVSVTEAVDAARSALPSDVSLAVLHGRLPADERDEVMQAFARGQVRVLVATTIIEVGVDVPGASVMLIESCERFGLAQLHQLRGRIGRGTEASHCLALHGPLSAEGNRRLEVFGATQDGFELAEADLEIRGPGELVGTRQAGLPPLQLADLVADRQWLLEARADAREILDRDPGDAGRQALLARAQERERLRPVTSGGG